MTFGGDGLHPGRLPQVALRSSALM
jgi:hypothetical protein